MRSSPNRLSRRVHRCRCGRCDCRRRQSAALRAPRGRSTGTGRQTGPRPWWRLQPERARQAVLQDHPDLIRAGFPDFGELHVVDQKSSVYRARGSRALCTKPAARTVAGPAHHGPARVPAPLRPGRGRGAGRLAADPGEEGAGGRPSRTWRGQRQDRDQAHRLHALLGRLRTGSARNRCSSRQSTWARIAPRVRHCASTGMANTDCGIR